MFKLISRLIGLATVIFVVVVAGYIVLVWQYRIAATPVSSSSDWSGGGTYSASIEFDGRQRSYLIHVPHPERAQRRPLVVLLHGGGGLARRTDGVAGMIKIAEREGFLVLLPQGVERNWNDGRPDSGSAASKQDIDDVGFITGLIDEVARRLPVDRKRVYATGISNGAMMSQRLACDAADRFAAVALVAGTAPASLETTCRPSRPVSVMAFNGTDDPLVPYEGGKIGSFLGFTKRGRVVGADELKRFWLERNACPELVPTDAPAEDVSTVKVDRQGPCAEGSEVVFYRIEGGGHTWPGGKQYLAPLLVGKTNRDVNASELIWAFFRAHSLP